MLRLIGRIPKAVVVLTRANSFLTLFSGEIGFPDKHGWPGDRDFHGLHVGLKTATSPLQSPGLDPNWDELLSSFGVIRAVLPEFRSGY
jgi:hypothetical protein